MLSIRILPVAIVGCVVLLFGLGVDQPTHAGIRRERCFQACNHSG